MKKALVSRSLLSICLLAAACGKKATVDREDASMDGSTDLPRDGGADGGDKNDGGEKPDIPDGGGEDCEYSVAKGATTQTDLGQGDNRWPVVLWNGSVFGVAWYDIDFSAGVIRVYFTLLDENGVSKNPAANLQGTILGTAGSLNNVVLTPPRLIWTGSQWGIAWLDDSEGSIEVYFARVDKNGVLQGSALRVTDDEVMDRDSDFPTLTWDGTHFAIAWTDLRGDPDLEDDRDVRDLYMNRIGTDGVRAGRDVRLTENPHLTENPWMVWNGVDYATIRIENRGRNTEAYFQRYSTSGAAVGSEVQLTDNGRYTSRPKLVWTGESYVAVVQDSGTGPLSANYWELDDKGKITRGPLLLSGNTDGTAIALGISYRDDHSLVTWTQQGGTAAADSYVTVVPRKKGEPTDPLSIGATPAYWDFAAGAMNPASFVAWTDRSDRSRIQWTAITVDRTCQSP